MDRNWKEEKNSHKKHKKYKIPDFWFMTLAFLASLGEPTFPPANSQIEAFLIGALGHFFLSPLTSVF